MDFNNWLIIEEVLQMIPSLILEANDDALLELMIKAKSGDEAAGNELMSKLLPIATAAAAKKVGRKETQHDDIAMEALTKFWNKFKNTDEIDISNPRRAIGYLKSIVSRKAIDFRQGIEQKWGGFRGKPITDPNLSRPEDRFELKPGQWRQAQRGHSNDMGDNLGDEGGGSPSMAWDTAGGARGSRGKSGAAITDPTHQASSSISPEGGSPVLNPSTQSIENEKYKMINTYVNGWADEKDSSILQMSLPAPFGKGMSNNEIGTSLGMNPKTIGSQKKAAMERMKHWIWKRYSESTVVEWVNSLIVE